LPSNLTFITNNPIIANNTNEQYRRYAAHNRIKLQLKENQLKPLPSGNKIKILLKWLPYLILMPSVPFSSSNQKNSGLIIIFGQSGSGKTALLHKWAEQYGYPYLTIGSLVSRKTMGSSPAERPHAVQREFQQAIEEAEGDVVLCDNPELLFASELALDPLPLLRQAARRKKVVVAWSGSYESSSLTYAEPGHDEYRSYSHTDIRDINLYSVHEAKAL